MARCWVLRKRAGLVVSSGVLCAVRMGLAGGGARSSLSSGLLLCSRWRACRVLLVACVWGGPVGLFASVRVWWVARAYGHRTALLGVSCGVGLSGLIVWGVVVG